MVDGKNGQEEETLRYLEKCVSLMQLKLGLLAKQGERERKSEEMIFNEEEDQHLI